MRWWILTLVAAGAMSTLLACDDDKDDDDDDDDSSDILDDTGGDDDDADDTGTTNVDAPQVIIADIWCYEHATGEKRKIWVATASVDDPQGSDTIESFISDGIIATAGGTEVATYALVCADGSCTTSFDETQDSIACGNATAYTFVFKVVDEDDNWSDPYEVVGRQGTDAAG